MTLSIVVLLENEYHYDECHFIEHLGIAVVVIVVAASITVFAGAVTYVAATMMSVISLNVLAPLLLFC